MLFDKDSKHIYGLFNNGYGYEIFGSSDEGNPFTWNKILSIDFYSLQNPEIYLQTDDSVSGSIYYLLNNKFYHSNDYGLNFTKVLTLSSAPVGFFVKPGTNKYFFAYPNKIISVENDSVVTTLNRKSIVHSLELYPLQKGNLWSYFTQGVLFDVLPVPFSYYEVKIVKKDSVFSNGKKYFGVNWAWQRVDSLEGKVYVIFQSDTTEYLLVDLIATRNDYKPVLYGNLVSATVSDTILWSKMRSRITYKYESLDIVSETYTQGIGVTFAHREFDFGYSSSELKGAVINGKLFGDTTVVSVKDDFIKPIKFKLTQNYPNPFNPTTKINYSIPIYGLVILKVYDLLGREIETLVNEEKLAGNYQVTFDAGHLSSGVYFYRLTSGSFSDIKKMILIR